LRELTPQQLEELNRYGFDRLLFESWRASLRSGRASVAANHVREPLLPPQPGDVADFRADPGLREAGAQAIARGELGVLILNGGMATRFGGVVKGVVDVLGPGRSFLALKLADVRRAQAAHGGRIPVFVMNSFATDEATRAHFAQHGWFGLPRDQVQFFTQFVSVRLTPDGDLFLDERGLPSWYGPGHGDCPQAFARSGLLERFLQCGGRHLFVSNVDNLGARVDAAVLGHHVRGGRACTVEVAPKQPGDVGGSPFRVGGRLQLIEQIRYPPGFDPSLCDVFNTNTFTLDAPALRHDVPLDYYYVEKKVGGRVAVQFERLLGEVTRTLPSSYLRVPRDGTASRFHPVKTPEDLATGRAAIAAMYPG
jgi:UTP--glucose-1-phosphate uridylyltransferase